MADNIKATRERIKAIAAQMADMEDSGIKTAEQRDAYKALVGEGTALRDQLTALEDGAALKAWASGSQGTAAQKALSQEVTSPEDRDQEQRAQDKAASNAYKSAFEAYLRYGSRGIEPSDRKILQGGAIKAADAMKALGETTATGGGFLVPEQFQAEVLKKTPGLIGLVDIVRHQPTTRDSIRWPTVSYTTDNYYTGPQRLTFTGEVPASATTARVTDQTFGTYLVPVNLAMASQLVSNSLIEDGAVDVMSLVAEMFRENIMQDVEYYIAQGTGSGQPEGITVNTNAQTNKVVSGSAATITSAGLISLYWETPAQYRAAGKWVMSSSTAELIAKLTDANGRYIWQASDMFGGGLGSVQQDGAVIVQPKLLGAPVVISEQMPAVTTNSYPITFGNHNGYIMAERVGMTVRVLDELYAETDQKLFLLRMRFGGGLAQDYKIKLQKIST